MRQAQDNEIIKTSMDIRMMKTLEYSKGKDVWIAPKSIATIDFYNWADQIIVATNAQRNKINNMIRENKHFGDLP